MMLAAGIASVTMLAVLVIHLGGWAGDLAAIALWVAAVGALVAEHPGR